MDISKLICHETEEKSMLSMISCPSPSTLTMRKRLTDLPKLDTSINTITMVHSYPSTFAVESNLNFQNDTLAVKCPRVDEQREFVQETGSSSESLESQIKAGRGVPLPTRTTRALLKWLLEHHRDPFPTPEEKSFLKREYNLTTRQLNNWFINARRRVLTKMQLPDGPFVATKEWIEAAETLTRRGRRSRTISPGRQHLSNYYRPVKALVKSPVNALVNPY